MKILVISDEHTEFFKRSGGPIYPPILEDWDVTICAGDIGVGLAGMNWAREMFPDRPLIYVMGNHERYHHEYHDLNVKTAIEADRLNISLLNPGTVVIDDVTFIGATLWTDFKLEGYRELEEHDLNGFADFTVIDLNDGPMTMSAMKQINQLEHQYIENMLDGADNSKTVVITHFVPSQVCIHPKWAGNPMNPYFTNDLDKWFDKYKYPLHIFGHTHDRYDGIHPYGTRLVANPRGYPMENAEPYAWKFVEV